MIIFRYLSRELLTTLIALTGILLFIFMSNQGVLYLNRAANGSFPGIFVLKLMLLEMPNLLGFLLPLGWYMAIMIAYGRLYADSEMMILFASGYSPLQLLFQTLCMASGVTVIVAVLMFWGNPWIALERAHLLKSTGVQTALQMLMPGRFQALPSKDVVFYVESMGKHQEAQHVFFARQSPEQSATKWEVIWAESAFGSHDKKTGENYLVLSDGRAYTGVPGQANVQLAQFKQYHVRLPHPTDKAADDIRTTPSAQLWEDYRSDPKKAAELQWRFSIPLMVLILTSIAVPLSRVNPRSGKYANILPAIIIFIFYANSLFVSRAWIASGRLPGWLGMSGLHVLMLCFAGALLVRQQRLWSRH